MGLEYVPVVWLNGRTKSISMIRKISRLIGTGKEETFQLEKYIEQFN
jgi:hypothetical protein